MKEFFQNQSCSLLFLLALNSIKDELVKHEKFEKDLSMKILNEFVELAQNSIRDYKFKNI